MAQSSNAWSYLVFLGIRVVIVFALLSAGCGFGSDTLDSEQRSIPGRSETSHNENASLLEPETSHDESASLLEPEISHDGSASLLEPETSHDENASILEPEFSSSPPSVLPPGFASSDRTGETGLPLPVAGSEPRTWYVRPDLSGDVATIQDAIDVAAFGDEIVLAPGTYSWSGQGSGTGYGLLVIWNNRDGFTIRGEGGSQETIIDAEGQGRCLYVMGHNDNVVFEGITFRGGDATRSAFGYGYGGGVCIHLTSPVFRDCVFRDNFGDYGGGFATAGVCASLMENCDFYDNTAGVIGGGVLLHNSTRPMTFDRCRIFGNISSDKGGGVGVINVPFLFQRTEIFGNLADGNGAAVLVRTASDCRFETTTIVGNTGFGHGQVHAESFAEIELDRCIVAFGSGDGTLSAGENSSLQVSCSNVYGNGGGDDMGTGVLDLGGNFSLDPLFWDGADADFRLRPNSPCAPDRHPDGSDCGTIGAWGTMKYATELAGR